MFITKEKTLNELPPTSCTIHGQFLWSHYFVYLSSNICSAAVKHSSLQNMNESLKMSCYFQPRILPYHQTILQSVVVRRDVQRIVDGGRHSMHGILRLYELRERIGFWKSFE